VVLAGLEVELVRKEIKNLHLAVYPPDGRIRLAAPIKTDISTLEVYIASKIPWIRKQQRAIDRQPRQSNRLFEERESHFFQGRRYLLRIAEQVQGKKPEVRIFRKKFLELRVQQPDSFEMKRNVVESFYRAELRKTLDELIPIWEARMGVTAAKWRIKSMKTKWGSCNPDTGNLLFNLELAKQPIECVEYVVALELAHLLERTHNGVFQAFLNQHLPNWRLLRERLAETPIAVVI
jgi:predicted metal-dependent hydrolase